MFRISLKLLDIKENVDFELGGYPQITQKGRHKWPQIMLIVVQLPVLSVGYRALVIERRLSSAVEISRDKPR